tara:strand:- start:173 stop:1000 length:828 start_codon:yes stop_codon:yes gene_type:complete
MKTYVGFNQGQYGDLFVLLTAARVLKRKEPDSKLIYSINKRYEDCKEIFKYSDDIDDIVIWEQYDGWPNKNDEIKISELENQYEGLEIFDPMPKCPMTDWYNSHHQTTLECRMHNVGEPTEEEMDFKLNKPEVEKGDYVCICPATSFGENKNLTPEIINKVKEFCLDGGLELIQISSSQDPLVDGAERFDGNYYESILKVLGSKFLVSADTGMIWASSAFSHPTIGLYSYEFYPLTETSINWRPKNKKQISLESDLISNIDMKDVADALERVYNV